MHGRISPSAADMPNRERQEKECIRILHISDTHGLHRTVEEQYPMPEADVLIHAGDFTDSAHKSEFIDFNKWLGTLHKRYPVRIVIAGNHEYKQRLDPEAIICLLTNATVLEHETLDVNGLCIFGSPWVPGQKAACPGDGAKAKHRFAEIPEGVDILLTHGSPFGIMDCCERAELQWGGSKALRHEIMRARPRVHMFGHMHEQRGLWHHQPGMPFAGGIEYELRTGEMHPTWEAPPDDYPCEFISCNAMKNHPGVDEAVGKKFASRIAGPARLILAERVVSLSPAWSFRVPGA